MQVGLHGVPPTPWYADGRPASGHFFCPRIQFRSASWQKCGGCRKSCPINLQIRCQSSLSCSCGTDSYGAPVMAKLYFSYAAMNAGKSTILLQAAHNYFERGMQTSLYTSSLYVEGGIGKISSRIGLDVPANLYDNKIDLFADIATANKNKKIDCIFVDEAQFLTSEQVWQLARVADHLKIPIMCFGLRTDFQGKLFEGSAELLAIADVLREIRTICDCGSKATMVVRMDENGQAIREGDQVSIGKDVYVSLCRRHWEERMRPNKVVNMDEHSISDTTEEDDDEFSTISAIG